jgi:hypothetical protein
MAFQITSGENALLKFGLFDIQDADTWKGQWEASTTYGVGDAVFLSDNAYECTGANTNEQPPDSDWTVLTTAISAADIQSILVELIDATGKVRVNWAYATVGDVLSSGTLVVGARYRIKLFVSGDAFENVGAASDATGVTFTATDDTPTIWTNSSQLQQISAPTNLSLSDGLVEVELLAQNTVNLAGEFEVRISVAETDTDYIGSGAETQVTCLEGVILISPC